MSASYKYPHASILIFAKAPIAGLTKTRMQPELSPQQSARLQEKLIQHICQISHASQLCPVELWCTPSIDHPLFATIKQQYGFSLHTQNNGDLGERIWQSLQTTQTRLILGTDCPYLNSLHLEKLLSTVENEHNDIGIIPAHDGGYIALSCKQAPKALFNNIDWGSEQVYAQTIAAATNNKLKIQTYSALSDIDRYDDYVQMCKNMPNLQI